MNVVLSAATFGCDEAQTYGAGVVRTPVDELVALHLIIRIVEFIHKMANELGKQLHFRAALAPLHGAVHHLAHMEGAMEDHAAGSIALCIGKGAVLNDGQIRSYTNIFRLDDIHAAVHEIGMVVQL